MILLLDTSTPICRLSLVDGDWRFDDEWEANRTLAKELLEYLQKHLETQGKTWSDISGIGVFRGPGSFTGLRIGLTVLNTLADAMDIPIIGTTGDAWQSDALKRLHADENERTVLPFYGAEAHTTKPRS